MGTDQKFMAQVQENSEQTYMTYIYLVVNYTFALYYISDISQSCSADMMEVCEKKVLACCDCNIFGKNMVNKTTSAERARTSQTYLERAICLSSTPLILTPFHFDI